MFVGLGFLVFAAAVLLPLYALIDLLRTPAEAWKASGQNQIVWALVILFAGSLIGTPVPLFTGATVSEMMWLAPAVLGNVIGALAYLIIARPKLAAQHVHSIH